MKLLNLNIIRMFRSWNVYVAIVIIVLSTLFTLKSNAEWYNFENIKQIGSLNLFIFGNTFYNNIIIILAPLISALPFCGMICDDIKTGYINNIITRSNPKKYIVNQATFAAVSGGLIFVVVFLFELIVFALIDPAPSPMIVLPGMLGDFFKNVYAETLIGYCVAFIMHSFIIGFIYALLGFGIGLFLNKIFVFAIPTLLFYILIIISDMIMTTTGKTMWFLPARLFQTNLLTGYYMHLIHLAIVFAIAICVICLGFKMIRNGEIKFKQPV